MGWLSEGGSVVVGAGAPMSLLSPEVNGSGTIVGVPLTEDTSGGSVYVVAAVLPSTSEGCQWTVDF